VSEDATAGHDADLSWLVDVSLQVHSTAQHSMVWQDTGAGLIGGLEHSLIGEGATARHDADLSWLVDVPLQTHSTAQRGRTQGQG
jgi:hypothetical protein